MSQVLSFVRDVLGEAASIKLHLNPRLDLSDMPLKSFYRWVAARGFDFLSTPTRQGVST
jgi:hypothetical protein